MNVSKLLFDNEYRFLILSNMGFYKKMNDEDYLKKKFKCIFHRELNLNQPVTYNEKLQWLKIHDRKEYYSNLVDKYKVREYVKELIGEQYLISLIGAWDSTKEIDFDNLPNSFVLKCNHNSGLGMYVCHDKSKMNTKEVIKNLNKGLKQNYYYPHREWPYKNVKPKIICEQYIGDTNSSPDDYKFLVINGKIDNILICKDRDKGKPKFFYFNTDWERMYCQKEEPEDVYNIKKPDNLDEMMNIVYKLSKGFKTIRIDLYNVNGKIYFGEFTFFDSSGFEVDITEEEDLRRGNKLEL